MKHSQSIAYTLAIICCATAAALAPIGGGDFAIDWHTIDGGGGTSTGGGFELAGTIGQHDAGPVMTGGNFAVSGGFWPGGEASAATTPPNDFNAFRGFHLSGGLADVLGSDDSYLCYNPGIVLNPSEAPVTLDFFGTLPTDAPLTLEVTIESSANTVGLELTFSFFNYNTNSWDVVGTAPQSLNADTVRTLAGIPADHVEPGTGQVRTRYEVRVVSFIFLFPWLDCVDHVFWTTTN